MIDNGISPVCKATCVRRKRLVSECDGTTNVEKLAQVKSDIQDMQSTILQAKKDIESLTNLINLVRDYKKRKTTS